MVAEFTRAPGRRDTGQTDDAEQPGSSRATFTDAGLEDTTRYLAETLAGDSLATLLARPSSDAEAVRYALAAGVDDDVIDSGAWPPGYDLDAAAYIVRRSLAEVAAVPLP